MTGKEVPRLVFNFEKAQVNDVGMKEIYLYIYYNLCIYYTRIDIHVTSNKR